MIEFIHTSHMTNRIAFHVPGVPVPQGSKRAFVMGGKARMVEQLGARHTDWRARVSSYATEARLTQGGYASMLAGTSAVRVSVVFAFARPKCHFGTGRNSEIRKASAPTHHTQTPDRDKLLRAVCDSMTGILFKDDSQIVCGACIKVWADGCDPGAWIVVEPQDGWPQEARNILDTVQQAATAERKAV